jgi:predicted aspartyl protease
MGRFSIDLEVSNHRDVVAAQLGVLPTERIRRARVSGVVDTRATRLVLPEKVVRDLGLPVSGRITVRFADGRQAEKDVAADVELQIQNRSSVFSAVVEPGRPDALVGAIVLEELDFVVDCPTQKLVPRDPHGMFAELD